MAALRLALRRLTKAPVVTAVAILSLALGIGANAAIFSLFDQMVLRSLPVHDPGRLVNLANPGPKPGSQSCGQAGDCDEVFSYLMFRDLEKQADQGFAGIALHLLFGANLADENRTVNGQGLFVSGSYFPLLGLQPALGRLLGPGDDRTIGEPYVAVLGWDYWQGQLGSDPAVLNRQIVVNGHPLTVVGVAPRGFDGTTLGGTPDVFVPVTLRGKMHPWFDAFENRRHYSFYLFGRLTPGLSIEQAGAEIQTIYHAIVNEVEAPLQEGMSEQTMARFRAKPIVLSAGWRGQSPLHDEVGTPLTLLFAITGVVLLIACANIANLLLARGAERGQEMAVRGSLGASRGQLVTQLLTESCLLALLGGAASLLVARWTLGFIRSMLPADDAGLLMGSMRPSVLLFAAVLSIATGIVFGLYPALHSTRPDLVTILKGSSGQPSGGRGAARFRTALVTAQIALSMALLVTAGLFIKSLVNVSRVDLGLAKDDVVAFGLSPILNGYEPERSLALFEGVEQQLAAIPGVSAVSVGRIPILTGSNWGTDVNVQGFENGPDIDSNSRFNEIGPGYFSLLGIPLIAGREFTTADRDGAPQVAVVNEAFAAKFGLEGPEVVGTRMSTDGEELDIEIVGFVQDAKYSEVKRDVPPLFFTPYRQDDSVGAVTFYVRTATEPDLVLRAIPGVIRQLDRNLPVEDLTTLEQQVRDNVMLDRMIGTLAAAFAILATLLAAFGLYGVLSYTVAQRTQEIGLRMALGADRRKVLGMVLRQVGIMTAVGGVIGVLVALGLVRAASSLLFGMEGSDPVVVAAVILLLSGIALGAGYVPAHRASRVDPIRALRYE